MFSEAPHLPTLPRAKRNMTLIKWGNDISGSNNKNIAIVTVECSVVQSVVVFHARTNLTPRSLLTSCVSVTFFSALPTETFFLCTSFTKNHVTMLPCTRATVQRWVFLVTNFNKAGIIAQRRGLFGIWMFS